MKYTHVIRKIYTEDALNKVFVIPKTPGMQGVYKPNGIWLSINGDWERWCKDCMPEWLTDRDILEVTLKKDINLWVFEDMNQFQKLFDKLTKDVVAESDNEVMRTHELINKFNELIKKKAINGVVYDGMQFETKNYNRHSCLADKHSFIISSYFGGWDCDSIVVWNTDKIDTINRRKIAYQ